MIIILNERFNVY